MKKVLIAILVFYSFTSFGQIQKDDKIIGNYGANIRISANISGTLTTGSIKSKAPLNERGIKRVGVIVSTLDNGVVQKVGFTMFGNSTDSLSIEKFLPNNILDSIFEFKISKMSTLDLFKFTEKQKIELLTYFEKDKNLKNPDAVELLNSYKANIDGIIFIKEYDLPDFICGSSVRLGAKGVYVNKKNQGFVYSGFQISVIDINTGKPIKAGSYSQASADYLPFDIGKKHPAFTNEQSKTISQLINDRHINNVTESLRMFKVLK